MRVFVPVGGGGTHSDECVMSVDMTDDQIKGRFQVSQSSAPGACKCHARLQQRWDSRHTLSYLPKHRLDI